MPDPPIVFSKEATQRTAKVVKWWHNNQPPAGRGDGPISGRDNHYNFAFTITAIGDDTLTCTHIASGKTGILVAKDYLNRRTPFDGTAGRDGFTYVYSDAQTRVSTKTSDSSTENQQITPSYVVGDEVLACSIGGPTLSEATELDAIRWIEITTRCWAKVTS